jgi:hypothetical protein
MPYNSKKLMRYDISIRLYMEDMDNQEAMAYIEEKIEELTTHEKAGFSTAKVTPKEVDLETGE